MLAIADRVRADPGVTSAPARHARFAAVINGAAAAGAGAAARRFERSARATLGPRLIEVIHASRGRLAHALDEALASEADVVLTFGGDGTARTALEMLTPQGVAVAPLPGGTLNRLSRNIYGAASIEALIGRIAGGGPRFVPGGAIGARRFFVASGYGEAMRLHEAREAWRAGRPADALRRVQRVRSRLADRTLRVGAFGARAGCVLLGVGPLDAAFGLAPCQAAESLEAAATNFRGLIDMIRFAPAALSGGWRRSRRVCVRQTSALEIRSDDGAPIPALLDGEYERLPPDIAIRYVPQAGLVWA